MSLPVYTPGQVLNASDCNQWFMPQVAYFTGTAQTINSTTFANVNGMSIAGLVAGTYLIEARFMVHPVTTSGYSVKFQFTTDTGVASAMQFDWFEQIINTSPGGAAVLGNSGMATAFSTNMQTSAMGSVDRLYILTGAYTLSTGGALTLQSASSAAATSFTIYFGTYVNLQRVA